MKKIFYILTFSLLFPFTIKAQPYGWSALGGTNGLHANGLIWSICSDASGNIYAVGGFTNDSGKYYVAKYDGTTWSELGGLNSLAANFIINSVCSDAAGNIYAGGSFTNDSGYYYVARYNGTVWNELGGLNGLHANSAIYSICSDASGNIYAAGSFGNVNVTDTSVSYYVSKYNGTGWSELGGMNALAANGVINAICADGAGNIYAAGEFTNGSTPFANHYVAKYNGATWSEVGGFNALAANSTINSICSDSAGNIYTAGHFVNADANYYVAKYNGTSWSELGGVNALAINNFIVTLRSDAYGNIYAAGWFVDSLNLPYVVKYNGMAWANLVPFIGVPSSPIGIQCICTNQQGNIYAPCSFSGTAPGSNSYNVAKYGLLTSIPEINSTDVINVFPNPTTGDCTLQLSGGGNYTAGVYDLTGREVLVVGRLAPQGAPLSRQATITFSTGSLSAGLYLVRVMGEEGKGAVRKLVVK